ncbi:hypothetical protein EB001_20915 [bacterium]|nr:hypothetical protein [bacterium]
MLDYAQSFEEFSKGLKPVDLALYAGFGLVLWVLFKEKLSPVQKLVSSVVDKVKVLLSNNNSAVKSPVSVITSTVSSKDPDVFFKLVASWKQTRDLAVASNCSEAVKVADQMFPYLSPNVCEEKKL